MSRDAGAVMRSMVQVEIQDLIIEGGRVAARIRWRNPTSERETIDIVRVDGGRAVEHWGTRL